jgi:hypothetical protein
LEFINKTNKFILDRELMQDLTEKEPDEILDRLKEYEKNLKEQKIFSQYYKVYDLSKFKRKNKFIEDIENDIKLFDNFLNKMEELKLTENDPKAQRLIEGIKDYLNQDRKVVVFTEYIDTAEHLKTILENHFDGLVLSAIGDISKTTFEDLAKNFDAQYKHQRR